MVYTIFTSSTVAVLHAKNHISLPSYYGSTFQRMTPVIPHGLTLATQEHYMVTLLCFTEQKRGNHIYRAHPDYREGGL